MVEAQPHLAAACRKLALSLVCFAVLPCVFIAVYVRLFRAPDASALPHLYVIATLGTGIAGLRLALALMPIAAGIRLAVSAVMLAATALSMLFFYSLVLTGLTHWGRVTTLDMATSYFFQVPELLNTLGHSTWVVSAGLAGLVAASSFLVFLFLRRHDWVAEFVRSTSRSMAGLTAAGMMAIAAASTLAIPDREWARVGEPVSLSIFPEQGESVMQSHAIDVFRSAQIDREDNAAREAYRPSKSGHRSNVIVIVSDALRADHLSLFGYARQTSPGLDALAQTPALKLKTSAVAACNESSCGLRALASSHYVDRQANIPVTLHETLKRHGYKVHLIFSGDHTNFDRLSLIYGSVDSYFDGASQRARYLNDDRLVTDQLDTFGPWDGTPTIFQFHLMSSHALGKRFDETPSFGPGENYTALRWGTKNKDMPQQATNFYDKGILQADRMIGEILKKLEARGYLRDAIVVITGDHGESLGERGLYSHTHSVWEESLRVPFVLMTFGSADAGRLTPNPLISQVDIAPTLLKSLDMPVPASWDGVPIQAASSSRIIYFQQVQFLGLLDGRTPGKLFKHWNDTRTGKSYTFDLVADAGEKDDMTSRMDRRLLQEWQELLAGKSATLAPVVKERLHMNTEPAASH
jgi:glucan phosphoethanolaminetransferase (alkaline phosphatase superfamily)